MRDMLCLLVALTSLALSTWAAQCNVEPKRILIQDTQVLPDVNGSNMIGMRATIGSPPQDILMLPWPELNNTWVYDYEPYCDDTVIWSDLICHIRRGGYFYENSSSSWDKTTNLVDAGGAPQETDDTGSETGIVELLSTSLDGADTIALSGTNLTAWPVGIPRLNWDHGYTTLHALGLGSNSTFLQSLVDAGEIAARVWSIFWGRMWIDSWLDGSVVLGGYDSDLVLGDNYTQALDYDNTTGCWTGMRVTITDVVLNPRDGSDVSIFPKHYELPTCIVPQRQLLLEAPGEILTNFETTTGMESIGTSYGLHWSAVQYLAKDVYDGDITISLSSGLSIRVPNSQFLTPFVQIGYDGARYYNESIKEFLFNPTSGQPSTLGRYFFTAAYLMVNHDANSFTMWQGNPTSASTLVPVMNEETAEACGNNVTGVVQQSATATATAAATSSGGASASRGTTGHVSAGAIAGGVVGGVAALVLIGVAAVFLVRRRRQTRQATHESLSGGTADGDDQDARTSLAGGAQGQVAGDKPHKLTDWGSPMGSPQELESTRPPSELPPSSRPSEVDGQSKGVSTWGSPGAVYEMDGRVYSFHQ